ncbi:MAG: BatA and WFA domain-containing protein [Aggregatilineales bacterium]
MNFLAPLAFIGGLLAIPIILMYMLRLRRREVMVSSNFLWQQVMQDREANTPWQRLRRNLLLFLQLLILALLVFTLARPYINVPAISSGKTILLLDASASMNATDIDGGSRFDEAKRQALDVVETLPSGTNMTVIRVSDVAEVLVGDTGDRARLRSAISNAQPGIAQADWDAALNLAVAGRPAGEEFTVVIIGDGGLGETIGLPGIEGELRYIPVGVSDENVAITALATRSLPGQPPQLFGQLTNYGAEDAEVVFSLRVDGDLVFSERYAVPANASLPIVSTQALDENFETIEAGLTMSVNSVAEDFLVADNVAYTVSTQVDERSVLLMTDGNLFLEQVLRSLPGIRTVRGNIEMGLPSLAYDLYIFDGYLPAELPAGDILFINPPASTELFTLGGYSSATTNPNIDSSDPRVAFVDFGPVSILRVRQVTGTAWADPLISVDGGALLLAGEIDGRQAALMPFDLRESNLPLDIAFPVLMTNLTEWFTPRDSLTGVNSISTGETLVIRPPFDAEQVRVTLPDGDERTLELEREILVFAETQQSGIYQIEALRDGDTIQRQAFVVNLFSTLESEIEPVPDGALQVGSVTVPVVEEEALGQRELWPLVIILALLMLMIEWYAYHRRLRVPTVMSPLRPRRV